LARDVQHQLKGKCKDFVTYSTEIGYSTDIAGITQLAVFIRGINEDFQTVKDLLELFRMKGKTSVDVSVPVFLALCE
jgi:hypothetical protein